MHYLCWLACKKQPAVIVRYSKEKDIINKTQIKIHLFKVILKEVKFCTMVLRANEEPGPSAADKVI
jgi:hypothetical protein